MKSNGKKQLAAGVFVLFLLGAIIYLFHSDIYFEKPLPILHQQNNSTYLDSINYVIDIYGLEKKQFDLRQHEKVYEWQHKSTIVIFVTVILVVLTGLYLSYKQFQFTNSISLLQAKHQAHGLTDQPKVEGDGSKQQPALDQKDKDSNSFEISKNGIKITSAVIGLIILAMSIAFFILYLQFVYPINLPK